MKYFLTIILSLSLLFIDTICLSQDNDTIGDDDAMFELSFGQSLLFISSSKVLDIKNEAAIVVPTSSILFFTQIRPLKKVGVPIFINIPTESKQFIVDGNIVSERASPSIGAGVSYSLLDVTVKKYADVRFEVSGLISATLDLKDRIRAVPIAVARVRLRRGEKFLMYLGCSYSFGINSLGLLYGSGTIF